MSKREEKGEKLSDLMSRFTGHQREKGKGKQRLACGYAEAKEHESRKDKR